MMKRAAYIFIKTKKGAKDYFPAAEKKSMALAFPPPVHFLPATMGVVHVLGRYNAHSLTSLLVY